MLGFTMRLSPDPAAAAASSAGALPDAAALVHCQLPTELGTFELYATTDPATGQEHAALAIGDLRAPEPVLVRIHSECLTGDTLFSLKCDCGPQLEAGMRRVAEAGRGVLVYLRQEGRGIGLVNKIRAYALQQAGADTVDANRMLGLPDDARDYRIAASMLKALGVASVRLLTNNPAKVEALEGLGVHVAERVPLHVRPNRHNAGYLATKALRMGHWPQPSAPAAAAGEPDND